MKSIRIISILSIFFFTMSACEKNEENQLPPAFMDSYADVNECLSFPPLKGTQPDQDQSCVSYTYDGDSILSITHFNSGFNCCPEAILTSFEIRNDTIFITEDDSLELCRCNCLYNVDFTIHNLPPAKYVISIEEPYVPEEEKQFVFDIDLENTAADKVCIDRVYYPWREL